MASPVMANGGMYPRDYVQQEQQNLPVTLPMIVTNDGGSRTTLKIPAGLLAQVPGHDRFGFRTMTSQTLFAGLALTAAAAFFFVVIGRRLSVSRATASGILLAVACYCAGGATADVPEPPEQRLIVGRHRVIVEITDVGSEIELVLGADAKWAH
jgi:hypothetical protein